MGHPEDECQDKSAENDFAGIMEFLRCRPENALFTKDQMRKFLFHMDNLLINSKYHKRTSIAKVKALLENYVNDTGHITKKTAEEEKNLID